MRVRIHNVGLLLLGLLIGSSMVNAYGGGIGVLVTRDREADNFVSYMKVNTTNNMADRMYRAGTYRDCPVIVAKTRPGLVNAAITAQAMIDHYQPDMLVSVGLCASVNDDLAVGTVVVARNFTRHDVGTHTDAGFLQGTAWYRQPRQPAQQRTENQAAWARIGHALDLIRPVSLATGDSFLRSSYKRAWVREKLQADAVDMSGAALEDVAAANARPLVVLRQVSDEGDEGAGDNFAEFATGSVTSLAGSAMAVIDGWIDGEVAR